MSKSKPDKVFSVVLVTGATVYAIARHGKGAKGVVSASGQKPSLKHAPREVGDECRKLAVNFGEDGRKVA